MSIVIANVAHENHQIGGVRESVTSIRGRGCMTHGRGRSSFETRPMS